MTQYMCHEHGMLDFSEAAEHYMQNCDVVFPSWLDTQLSEVEGEIQWRRIFDDAQDWLDEEQDFRSRADQNLFNRNLDALGRRAGPSRMIHAARHAGMYMEDLRQQRNTHGMANALGGNMRRARAVGVYNRRLVGHEREQTALQLRNNQKRQEYQNELEENHDQRIDVLNNFDIENDKLNTQRTMTEQAREKKRKEANQSWQAKQASEQLFRSNLQQTHHDQMMAEEAEALAESQKQTATLQEINRRVAAEQNAYQMSSRDKLLADRRAETAAIQAGRKKEIDPDFLALLSPELQARWGSTPVAAVAGPSNSAPQPRALPPAVHPNSRLGNRLGHLRLTDAQAEQDEFGFEEAAPVPAPQGAAARRAAARNLRRLTGEESITDPSGSSAGNVLQMDRSSGC